MSDTIDPSDSLGNIELLKKEELLKISKLKADPRFVQLTGMLSEQQKGLKYMREQLPPVSDDETGRRKQSARRLRDPDARANNLALDLGREHLYDPGAQYSRMDASDALQSAEILLRDQVLELARAEMPA